jgi:general secretion pathway protein G
MVDVPAHKSKALRGSFKGGSPPAGSLKTFLNTQGFTLVELLVVAVILGVLVTLAVPGFAHLVQNVKNSVAVSEIRNLEKDIIAYILDKGIPPNSLNDIGRGTLKDPWGNLYQYANIKNGDPPRINQFLDKLNEEFDLFSRGKDGLFQQNITDASSLDDIVRAGDGGWIGVAEKY